MDFSLNEEQSLLKASVERVIAERYTFAQRHDYRRCVDGFSREMWRLFAEMGLLALPLPARHGGIGGGPVETMIVMEAFGRALVVEPYLATVIQAGGALTLAGSEAQQAEWLGRIADGSLLMALAHTERQSRYQLADVLTTAHRDGAGWRLDGVKTSVVHGGCADALLVSARISGARRDSNGIALFLVDGGSVGISRRIYATQDGLRAADVTLDGVRVGPDAVIGEPGNALAVIERVAHLSISAMAAEAVGAMLAMHALTLEHLKTRRQFGAELGQFQVLQHRAADMMVALEQARAMVYFATARIDDPDMNERRRAMHAVKVQVSRSARFVGQQTIQLYGGLGMTMECAVGHYVMRTTMMETQFGDTDHHLAALARAGGLIPAEEMEPQACTA